MKPIYYVMHLYQEASWVLEATFKDADGNAIDLSSYAGELQIRRDVTLDDALLTIDSISGSIDLNANVSKNLIVKISATETAGLPTQDTEITDWVYDLKIWDTTDADYSTIRLLEGDVYVHPAVTRS